MGIIKGIFGPLCLRIFRESDINSDFVFTLNKAAEDDKKKDNWKWKSNNPFCKYKTENHDALENDNPIIILRRLNLNDPSLAESSKFRTK